MERGGGGRALHVSDCQQLTTALYPSGGGWALRWWRMWVSQTVRRSWVNLHQGRDSSGERGKVPGTGKGHGPPDKSTPGR